MEPTSWTVIQVLITGIVLGFLLIPLYAKFGDWLMGLARETDEGTVRDRGETEER